MNRIYLPSTGRDAWQALLADPLKHWRVGYSAYELAHAWESATGFPPAVKRTFATGPSDVFHGLEPLIAVPEHKVPLPGGSRPSQTDLWILARSNAGMRVSVAVEGKCEETFDELTHRWLGKLPSAGKQHRLSALCEILQLEQQTALGIRYQLLHRTAAALIEAERFGAENALMLVHSFSPGHAWYDDYVALAQALDATQAPLNSIVPIGDRYGIALYLGWAADTLSSSEGSG